MSETLLPMGTVVKLKDQTELIIIGRGSLVEQNQELVYFEYTSVLVPTGYQQADQLYFFNNSDIREVVFMGYKNDAELEFESNFYQLVKKSGFKKGVTEL
ncbi:DUF4176 domain-containing protein [Streptococcus sp. 27098_8_113]|uniref:DUF4176 domain-containing protein n=1 Tax=Streptococcus sp. 27098_8_113 TaxID=3003669 RepID=UPI00352CF537